MKTLFYVPKEEEVEPHIEEATMWGLTVIHGIPEKLKEEHPDFVFPESADIIKIPTISYLERSTSELRIDDPCAFLLTHEYDDLRKTKPIFSLKNIRSGEDLGELEPQWVEASRARWLFTPTKIGKYKYEVVVDGECVNDDMFFVYKD